MVVLASRTRERHLRVHGCGTRHADGQLSTGREWTYMEMT